jgi:Zinc finger C-x8-C-x5-C-x3-H type (and similar)
MSPWGSGRRSRGFGGELGRGNGWRGGRRGGAGRDKIDHGICRHFQQTGSCRFGLACKFSHDLSPEGGGERPSKERSPRPDQTLEQQRAKADYNSWKRIIKTPPRLNDVRTVEQLWNGALAILNGDEREWKQMVPRDLDDEEYFGRQYIKTLLTMRTSFGDYGAFIRLIRPFLLVITHSSFLDCLSVDTFVGGLYNFIGGTNGTRAVPFFQHLCETLVNAHVDTVPSATAATVETTLIATSTALRELLRRESRARFNDDLPILIDSTENAVQVITREAQSQIATIVHSQIGEMRAMVARAKGLLVQEEEQEGALTTTTVTSSYPRALVMPRDRHDNDKADITKIKIFPTREEILSDEASFLPSTDLYQPHFLADQVERHIDTHFRLLRHDTFGELTDLLGGLMRAVENDPTNPRLKFGDFRANQYSDAFISYVSFDSRRGLEMNISFTQPSIVRKKPTSERRKWWEESKRLTEGVLLSFISFQHGEIQHLFFIVAEKNTDTSKDHSLTKKDLQGTITVKLASHDQMNVESAIRLSYQKARGLLIEFPGILPATFIPILENLQDMQRLSRLPFRQWILPDRIGDTQEAAKIDIPPPLYARKPGFSFSLNPLLKLGGQHDGGISINPASSASDLTIVDEMEARTDLDRGQCRALLAALTREFAFIQGPPGTGKSYLGIQLMKVLMHLKKTVDLGPVVVV